MNKNKSTEIESLFEIFPDAVILIDPQTKLPVRYNKVAYTQLEYEEEEFKNISISDYEAIENPKDTKKRIEKILGEGRDDFETRHKTKYGKILDIRVTTILIEEDEKIYFLAVFRDITQERRLQRELDTQSMFEKTVLQNISYGLIVTDSSGIITSFNAVAQEMLAYAQEDVIGKETPILFHDKEEIKDRAKLLSIELQKDIKAGFEVFAARADLGLSDEREWTYVRKDGKKITVSLNVTTLKDGMGRVSGYLGMVSDITQKKAKELKDKRASDAVNFILENTVGGYWDWNLVTNEEYLSPGFKKMFGYEDHEMQNTPEAWMEIIFEEDLQKVFKLFDAHIQSKGKVPFISEMRYRHKNGSTIWVLCSGSVVEWDESGTALRMLGSHVDITEQKNMQNLLIESEKRFSDVAEASGEYIWELDAKGEYIFLTKPFEEMLGYELQESLGRSPFSFMPPDEEKRVGEYFMNEVAANGLPFRGLVHQSITKDGKRIWQKVNGLPMLNTEGEIVGYRGAALDITNEKNALYELEIAKEEAESANRAKSEFLANMSHEIRTPMNAIIGFGDILAEMIEDEKQEDMLHKINSSSKMLLGIINDILDFSKIEAGKLELESHQFSIEKILEQIKMMFEQKASQKNIELYFHLKGEIPPLLYGDSLRLTQALVNLLSNSVKFTHKGVIVLTIEFVEIVEQNRARLSFCVQDSGIGMNKTQLDKLFKPFTQADSSTTRKYGGTGLGLVITKNILKAMGAEIEVESEEGVGTKFSFTIDFDAAFLDVGSTKEKSLLGRVLVVDDQRVSRDVLKDMLARFECSVDEASDGAEAIEAVLKADREKKPYELILLDWNMPNLDGVQTIQKLQKMQTLKEIESKVPTVFMISAYAKNEIDLESIAVDAFISKPVAPSTLYNAINQAKGMQARGLGIRSETRQRGGFADVHVLVVEDNLLNQELIALMLDKVGITYEIASNGKEGLERFQSAQDAFDLILMDLQMPIMGGYEATRKIRVLDKKIPIVALTAAAMIEDKEKSLAMGMNEHIGKPIDKNELYKIISDLTQAKLKSDKDAKKLIKVLDLEYLEDIVGSKNKINSLLLYFKEQLKNGEFAGIVDAVANKSSDASAKIHSLKGVSGNLGAFELCEIVTLIDKKIKKDEETSAEELEKLANAKERLLLELETIEPNQAEQKSYEEISPEQTIELLQEVERLLKEGHIVEDDTISNLCNSLSSKISQDELEKFKAYVENFDFDDALDLILGWKDARL